MKIKNTKLLIVHSGLRKPKGDAVVVPVDSTLISLGRAINVKLKGEKSRHFISASVWKKNEYTTDETTIRLACADALRCANRLKLKSVILPALGFHRNNFPLVGIAKIMTQEVLKFLRENTTTLRKIIFCLDDTKTFRIFNKAVKGYVEHILYKLTEGPFVTVDAIIEMKGSIVLIERSNPPYGWALPGGFVDYGESLEEAVLREVKEETHMQLRNLRQFHTYSKPGRDPRFHTITTVFMAQGVGQPKFGDDAKGLKVIKYKDLLNLPYAFDHKDVIKDYLRFKKTGHCPQGT